MLKPTPPRVLTGIALGLVLLLIAAWLSASTGQICEQTKSGQEYCAVHNLAAFILLSIGKFLDSSAVVITALATVAIGWFTWTLKASTDKLWEAGERQIAVAENAAKSADASNVLAREVFITEQRPWLLWYIPLVANMTNNGRHLEIRIDGDLTNIGKAPAFNINYFGKFYVPTPGEAAINMGQAYFAEHIRECAAMPWFSLASAHPTEKIPMRFGPHGIDISTLPQDKGFSLYLSFHANYEFAIGGRRLAEIGTVYMVQPIGGNTSAFNIKDIGPTMPVALVEWHGARRIT